MMGWTCPKLRDVVMKSDHKPSRRHILTAGITGGLSLGVSNGSVQARPFNRPIVTTRSGQIVGRKVNSVIQFLGIPYATTQGIRFGLPQPILTYGKGFEASHHGPACPQNAATPVEQSENCQTISIFTPSLMGKPRSVMVYIHGGAYMTGSGADPFTDGSRLAYDENVVVVTITHRLNSFGYLYLGRLAKDLGETDPRFQSSGNLGQLDLIKAMEWIRSNIKSFGGNPNSILVMGQSGGGLRLPP